VALSPQSGQVGEDALVALIADLDPLGVCWRGAGPLPGPAPPPSDKADGNDEPSAFAEELDRSTQSPVERTAAVVRAARLLLAERNPAVALTEDVRLNDTDAIAHLVGQLFLARPELQAGKATKRDQSVLQSRLERDLQVASDEWAATNTVGWKEDAELSGLLAKLAQLCLDAEAADSQSASDSVWPLIQLRVSEYCRGLFATMVGAEVRGIGALSTGSRAESLSAKVPAEGGDKMLASRPALEASEAAAVVGDGAAGRVGEGRPTLGLVVGGGQATGFTTMDSANIADLIPADMQGPGVRRPGPHPTQPNPAQASAHPRSQFGPALSRLSRLTLYAAPPRGAARLQGTRAGWAPSRPMPAAVPLRVDGIFCRVISAEAVLTLY
jgi:hypothetical protein